MPEDVTDSQKIKLIPQLMDGLSELHRIIVTGDVMKGQPGLLESVRLIARDIAEIKKCQINYIELEKRVEEIEKRHEILDIQRKRIDEQKKKWDTYQLAIFGTLFSNIIMFVMWLLGFGK